MGRQYTIEHYRERLARIREAVPGITISTDVIVGFCGETEEQFEAHARAARDGPLRPGLRGGLLAATRARPRRSLADDVPPGRQAPPAQRAARGPGGASGWSATRPGSAATSRSSSIRSAPAARARRTTHDDEPADRPRVARPDARQQARPPRGRPGPGRSRGRRSGSSTPDRTLFVGGHVPRTGRADALTAGRGAGTVRPPSGRGDRADRAAG